MPEDVERALEASHAFFEPAHAVSEIFEIGIHAVAKICEAGIHAVAKICEAGIHVAAEICEVGIHVIAEIPILGIHMVSEIRDFAAEPLDVLAREAVQVEHDADDDGRGNPLEKFRGHLFFPE